jgi:hypothetical protein
MFVPSGRRLSAAFVALIFVALSAVLLPAVGEAQQVTFTQTTAPQYQAPASRAPLVRQGGQQATVFNSILPAPAPLASCPAPTLAQCKTTSYVLSACGQARQATCKQLLTAPYTAYFDNLAPKGLGPAQLTREMFPYGTPARFSDLKKGKFHGTTPTQPVFVRSKTFRDQTRITNAPANVDPKTYVPHADWDANGAQVGSCEEYAYEKYYDWNRLQDAASLCKGDYVCIYNVAYAPNAPPGVANRQQKRKDGQPMIGQITPVSPAVKNVFHTIGSFVTAEPAIDGSGRMSLPGYMSFSELKATFPAFAADFDQMKAAIASGGVNLGTSWTYHSNMRGRTINVTENEAEELARRRTELEFYVASIQPVSSSAAGAHFGLEANEFVHPLDEVAQIYTYDPWERTNIFQNETIRTQYAQAFRASALTRSHSAFFGPSGAAIRAPANTTQRSGAGVMGGISTGFVPTARPKFRAAAPTARLLLAPQLSCMYIPPMDVAACEANANNCRGLAGPDAMRNQNNSNWNEYAKCQITNLTIAEWWRKKNGLAQGGCNDRGSCGCLDTSNYACDWSPKMFNDAYVATAPKVPTGTPNQFIDITYLRDADYANCKQWTYDGFPTDAAKRASGDALEAYLREKRELVEKTLKKIPQKSQSPRVLGQDFSDGAQEGDTDAWSAGYGMTSGWEMKVAELKTTNGVRKTCQLQGNANAAFTAKITTPIDGVVGNMRELWNRAVDADVWARVNETDKDGKADGKVRYETHLLIADQELFAVPSPYKKYQTFAQFNPSDSGSHVSFALNKAFSQPIRENTNRTPKLTLTVWAGPVPITGAVWAELSYGANAIAKGEMITQDQNCSKALNKFEAMAGFEPYFNLSGAMSLGVGIGGIVSAGIRGYLTLIQANLPIAARTWIDASTAQPTINFGVEATLRLSSLSASRSTWSSCSSRRSSSCSVGAACTRTFPSSARSQRSCRSPPGGHASAGALLVLRRSRGPSILEEQRRAAPRSVRKPKGALWLAYAGSTAACRELFVALVRQRDGTVEGTTGLLGRGVPWRARLEKNRATPTQPFDILQFRPLFRRRNTSNRAGIRGRRFGWRGRSADPDSLDSFATASTTLGSLTTFARNADDALARGR